MYHNVIYAKEMNSYMDMFPKSISIYNDLNTTTGLEITETIKYNNWFYTYNETQNSMELHIF